MAITQDIFKWKSHITNEWLISSETKNTICAITTENAISTNRLFFIDFIIWENAIQKKLQSKIQPIIIHKNCKNHCTSAQLEKIQERKISYIIKNNANQVQSLKLDSHSKIYESLFGAQYSLNSAITATGSVVHIITAKSIMTSIGKLKPINFVNSIQSKDIKLVEINSPIVANHQVEYLFSETSLYFILYAASNNSIGKNT